MRILLQQKETGLYFESLGVWSQSSKSAMNFLSSTAAIEFCLAHGLRDVHLVLKFDDHKFDIVLPLHPGTPNEPPGDQPRV